MVSAVKRKREDLEVHDDDEKRTAKRSRQMDLKHTTGSTKLKPPRTVYHVNELDSNTLPNSHESRKMERETTHKITMPSKERDQPTPSIESVYHNLKHKPTQRMPLPRQTHHPATSKNGRHALTSSVPIPSFSQTPQPPKSEKANSRSDIDAQTQPARKRTAPDQTESAPRSCPTSSQKHLSINKLNSITPTPTPKPKPVPAPEPRPKHKDTERHTSRPSVQTERSTDLKPDQKRDISRTNLVRESRKRDRDDGDSNELLEDTSYQNKRQRTKFETARTSVVGNAREMHVDQQHSRDTGTQPASRKPKENSRSDGNSSRRTGSTVKDTRNGAAQRPRRKVGDEIRRWLGA